MISVFDNLVFGSQFYLNLEGPTQVLYRPFGAINMSEEKKQQQRWFPLESNPALINGYIEKLGYDTSLYEVCTSNLSNRDSTTTSAVRWSAVCEICR